LVNNPGALGSVFHAVEQDPRVPGVIKALMQRAKGPDAQKTLGYYFQRRLPEEVKKGRGPSYPDESTISRWMDALGVPAEALVVASFKILEEGGSIDELMGQADGLRSRLMDLEEWRGEVEPRLETLEQWMLDMTTDEDQADETAGG